MKKRLILYPLVVGCFFVGWPLYACSRTKGLKGFRVKGAASNSRRYPRDESPVPRRTQEFHKPKAEKTKALRIWRDVVTPAAEGNREPLKPK